MVCQPGRNNNNNHNKKKEKKWKKMLKKRKENGLKEFCKGLRCTSKGARTVVYTICTYYVQLHARMYHCRSWNLMRCARGLWVSFYAMVCVDDLERRTWSHSQTNFIVKVVGFLMTFPFQNIIRQSLTFWAPETLCIMFHDIVHWRRWLPFSNV